MTNQAKAMTPPAQDERAERPAKRGSKSDQRVSDKLFGSRIAGGNSATGRRAWDLYQTPPEATLALLNFLTIPKGAVIWECACGSGEMSRTIAASGYKVISSDIEDHGFGQNGIDFVTYCQENNFDWIITNPPFFLAEPFVRRAWEYKRPFAFLLKSQFWHAARRTALFEECPPSYILPLTWRPDFTGGGASLMDMIWTVWERRPAAGVIYQPLRRPKDQLEIPCDCIF